jgi:hypothetical protein
MTNCELLEAIDYLRNIMNEVATGGPFINDIVNDQFQINYTLVAEELSRLGINNPLPYKNLWDWYRRWNSGDMPTYQSRRAFVSELFNPLISRISTGQVGEFEPTGWARVDRTVGELRERLASATHEEQFQAVGLLCREVLISLAQAVHILEQHPTLDSIAPSRTDAKRMLDAYISVELGGKTNDEARKNARSALALAASLQHKRTAGFRDAAMCVEATTSIINIIAIISGRRDPN